MASSTDTTTKNDFSKGSVIKNILSLAVPMTLAQLINVLYNIADRIYIGRIPENATLALTGLGLGLCLPIISMVMAFANLFGMGGAPLCSIERGRGNEQEAEAIMGNSFVMMVLCGLVLTLLGLLLKRPMLYLFGASDLTIPYADSYITIYLLGSTFVMIGLGMNSFINSQGLSALWILRFLTGKQTILRLRKNAFRLKRRRILDIVGLGLSGFTMSVTNSLVQIMYNSNLALFGGDLYVGIMTVVNSVREVISLPIQGPSQILRPGCQRNLYGRTHLQFHRRPGLLRNHAYHCLART